MNGSKDTHRYDDIINLPHPVSTKHPQMSVIDRAAQFSPFAALTGYDAAIAETARQTTEKAQLGEDAREVLDRKQQLLIDMIHGQPEVSVTYFVPDKRKTGGSYVTATGNVKKFDMHRRTMVMTDGTSVPLDDILELESSLFHGFA